MSSEMGVFEGMGGWGLGKRREISRVLSSQSMVQIGAIWIYLDFSFSAVHISPKNEINFVRCWFGHPPFRGATPHF